MSIKVCSALYGAVLRVLSVVVVVAFLGAPSLAQEIDPYSVATLFIDEEGNTDLDDEPFYEDTNVEGLDFVFEAGGEGVYDRKYDNIGVEDLKSLTLEMQTDSYKDILKEGIAMPLSSSNIEDVEDLLTHISEDQIGRFLAEKEKFLNQIAKLFLFMSSIKEKIPGVKPTNYIKLNELLQSLNDDLFKKSSLLVEENTKVINISSMATSGFSFSDKLVQLAKKRFGSAKLLERLSFYFYFGLGFSVEINRLDGRRRIRVRPTSDLKWASEIYAPLVLLGGGLITTFNIQEAEYKPILQSKILSTPVTSLITGGDMIGFTIPTAAFNLAFGGAWAMALSGKLVRVNISPATVPKLFSYLSDLTKKATQKSLHKAGQAVRACKNILIKQE